MHARNFGFRLLKPYLTFGYLTCFDRSKQISTLHPIRLQMFLKNKLVPTVFVFRRKKYLVANIFIRKKYLLCMGFDRKIKMTLLKYRYLLYFTETHNIEKIFINRKSQIFNHLFSSTDNKKLLN